MIYVDEVTTYPASMVKGEASRWGLEWSHLWSDLPGKAGENELRDFARRCRLSQRWCQTHHERFHHFDIVPSRRARAVALGAVEVNLITYLRERRREHAHD